MPVCLGLGFDAPPDGHALSASQCRRRLPPPPPRTMPNAHFPGLLPSFFYSPGPCRSLTLKPLGQACSCALPVFCSHMPYAFFFGAHQETICHFVSAPSAYSPLFWEVGYPFLCPLCDTVCIRSSQRWIVTWMTLGSHGRRLAPMEAPCSARLLQLPVNVENAPSLEGPTPAWGDQTSVFWGDEMNQVRRGRGQGKKTRHWCLTWRCFQDDSSVTAGLPEPFASGEWLQWHWTPGLQLINNANNSDNNT